MIPDSFLVAVGPSKTPTSPYAADKLSLDHHARLYDELYGLPTVSGRSSTGAIDDAPAETTAFCR